mgnify:CR=1 FL=1
MNIYFAPMEGVTSAAYRNAHRKPFPGVDRYYAPFISPTVHRALTPREARELPPADSMDITVVPQLLTKVAGIDNAILRVAAAAGVKIGSEVTEEELQLFLEPLYRTLVFGEDYSAPAMEEILYTALLTAITTTIVE